MMRNETTRQIPTFTNRNNQLHVEKTGSDAALKAQIP